MKSVRVVLFTSGNSQAVRLPKGFDFPSGGEVYLQRVGATDDVLVSRRPGESAWRAYWSSCTTRLDDIHYLNERPLNVPLLGGRQ